jgi:mono/diheme cytochrome c family protein
MRVIFVSALIALLTAILAGIAFIYSGLYDVAATNLHWPVTRWAMETARMRSIKAHAAGIQVPHGLDKPAQLQIGVEHFATHCAVCHGAPGVPRGEIAEGLYPRPPNLALSATRYSDAELFWIVKHGIKMTGMPGWGNHSDEELWAIVAFIKQLPGMSQQAYARLVMTNVMNGTIHHHGRAEAPPPTVGGEAVRPGTQPKPGEAHASHEQR